MTPSRSLHVPAVLILGASLIAAPALVPLGFAQTASAAAATPAPANNKVVEDIVARVNDQIITQSDYDRAAEQMASEARQQGASAQDLDDRNKNLLRDLIDQQLLLSRGKELGITGEAELVHRLDDIRKQNHLDSMEELEKAAQEQGVSYEDFKASIRNGIITQQVIRDEVSRHVQLNQADVQAYFKAHESEFAQPESVHLREIMIATPVGSAADSAVVTAAQQQADAIEQKLQAGANFEELAKTSSSGPEAAQGGDLGDFPRGKLAKQLEDQTFSLKAGQFTEPIRTKQGFVILQVAEHTPGGDASFKDVQPQVEEAVFEQNMQPALRQYLTKLREAAYIDIKPGLVDSGASPNEIRPSYSAYVPPAPKKKKKFVRTRFRGRVRSNSTSSNLQAAGKGPSTAGTPASGTASKAATQVASTRKARVQKPGKKEKVRFGQAPRESLPAGAGAETQTASATSPDVHAASSDSAIGAETPEPEKPGKTRFSDRAPVHKVKKAKGTPAGDDKESAPSQDELASQKVQDAPLGLAEQQAKAKKEKKKGDKTRYSEKQKQPEQPAQQPYMGGQQPVDASKPAPATQPAAAGDQPASKSSAGSSSGEQP